MLVMMKLLHVTMLFLDVSKNDGTNVGKNASTKVDEYDFTCYREVLLLII